MLIASKISQPDILQSLIERPRLHDALQTTPSTKLILVCAPAGYSKTSTIVQWCKSQPNVAWYGLDKFDNNQHRFANYLIQTIYNSAQGCCEKSLKMVQQRSFANLTTLFTQLFDEISQTEQPLTLVLDDYHNITDPEINQGMKLFIKYMPVNWKVVITSRTRPPLSLSSLHLKQELIEINIDMLAFDLTEVRAFFNLRLDFEVDDDTLSNLNQKVEGWPSSLQLVALTAKSPTHFLQCSEQIAKSQHAQLWDYLEDEVFEPLEESTKQLLLDIAPLKQIDAEMVNLLTQRHDGQQVLEQLEAEGLFLIAQDMQKQWFSFISLFKGYLLHKKNQDPKRLNDDEKIAKLWLQRDMPIYALPHALYSKNTELLTELLLKSGWAIFHEGELSGLDLCFDLIGQLYLNYPKLILLKAWMFQSRHQNDQVRPLLEEAKSWWEANQIGIPTALNADFDALEAQVAISQGNIELALQKAQSAITQTNDEIPRISIIAQSVIGEALHCQGLLSQSYKQQEQVKQLSIKHQFYQSAAWAMYQQVELLYAQANKQEAERQLNRLLELMPQHNLDQLPLYTFPLLFKALLAYQDNQLEQAQSISEKAYGIASLYGEQWVLSCYSLQAKIALEQGNEAQGKMLIEKIEQLLHSKHYHSDWVANANYARLKYWRFTGDYCAMRKWLETAPIPASGFNRFDQCHGRNRIRALVQLGELEQAKSLCLKLISDARQCQLQVEINRNQILLSTIELKLNNKAGAKASLAMALDASLFTGLSNCFIRHGQKLIPLLLELQQEASVTKAVKDKISTLLEIAQYTPETQPETPFDAIKVSQILEHPQVPSLVKNIPLTSREWQVLGFIYNGYTNDKISKTMNVAPTTVKSHIRNIYQKLGLSDRNEAINLSNQLLTLGH